jgi:hypothetical protein
MRGKLISEILTIENFRKKTPLLICLLVLSFLFLDAGGCARLRVVEKETHDPKTDTYTTKYKNLPEWAEYALGTLVGAAWGLATLSMFIPSKSKPEHKKTADRELSDKSEAKVDYMLDKYGERRQLKGSK